MYKVVHKPWGKEEWLELNDAYCYKRIYINAGYKTSFQYHQFKKETNYIISGEAEVWLENDEGVVEKKIMKGGEFFNVTPPKKHRVIAITDIILQEVSTPHVDDVFRINDEFNRADGKIEAEHKTPAVLILAAGLGTRLKNLTKNINKAMIPVANRAIISHIIEKFPTNYDIVVATGYKGEALEDYCKIAHPEYNFTFVKIDEFQGDNTGPGYSARQCKDLLQRPFYFTVADCLIDGKVPHLDGNWLGVHPTSYPEKYATLETNKEGTITNFANKDINGYDNAFIGLASIWDYETFWKELGESSEIVAAFKNPSVYPSFKAKELKWLDTGNLDDLERAREHFGDEPLSLAKNTGEITYKVGDKFVKFNPDVKVVRNKTERAEQLNKLIPPDYQSINNFMSYKWEKGSTLYSYGSQHLYVDFLKVLKANISKCIHYTGGKYLFENFYAEKTKKRVLAFTDRFGLDYLNQPFTINDKPYDTLYNIYNKISVEEFYDNPMYSLFHGDLQFDNIIFNALEQKYTYIDWRESFGGSTQGGDLYYDLAKLYGGSIIPYDLMKEEDSIRLYEGSTSVKYDYYISGDLIEFRKVYERWIVDNGFSLDKVKKITGLIFLNMSPLHDEKFAKMLWFKAIEILDEYYK